MKISRLTDPGNRDEHRVSPVSNSISVSGFVVMAAMIATSPLLAQVMNDPTRPPASVLAGTAGDDGQAAGPLLQSVMISPTERSAIISGERVKQGGTYGDARIIRITDNAVVLRSAGGMETLLLYPDVEIKPVRPAAVSTPRLARKPRKRRPAAK